MKIRKLSLLWVVLFIMSCADNDNAYTADNDTSGLVELTPEELISVSYDDAGLISSEEALQIVRDFQKGLQQSVSRTCAIPELSIKQCYNVGFDGTRLLSAGETRSVGEDIMIAPVYEVSLNDGRGMALVAGDERASSVLAYVPELPDVQELGEEELNLMLEWSKAGYMATLQKQKEIRDKEKENTIKKIASELSIQPEEVTEQVIAEKTYVVYGNKAYTRSKPIANIPGQIEAYSAPLLHTNWSQKAPYNSMLETHDKVSDGYGGYERAQIPAGCAIVNLAQLYAFCEPEMVVDGMSIDWSLLKQTPTITDESSSERKMMVAALYKQLYEEAQSFKELKDGIVVGSSTYAGDFARVLTSRVDANSQVAYDADEVYGSLLSFRPCVIRGEGHSFTIDGYIISEKITRQILKSHDMYWHAVLGWGSDDTSWYKLDLDTHLIFESGGHTFNTKNLMILSHIRPKHS